MVSTLLPQALSVALDDEIRARATYLKVLECFGPVAPFNRIVEAEQRHIDALLPLFQRYGVPLPADRWSGRIPSPASVSDACHAGVRGEIGNYQMYDRLLEHIAEPDVRAVFLRLRNASAFNHLPAFQACASQHDQTESKSRFLIAALGLAAGVCLTTVLMRHPAGEPGI